MLVPCVRCSGEFPGTEEFFSRDKTRRSGLHPYCKECTKQGHREYYKRNRSKILEAGKIYSTENKDRIQEYREQYAARNAEALLAKGRAYAAENREQARERAKRWYAENRARGKANARRRKARLKSAVGDHTLDDLAEILKIQDNKCRYCSATLGSSVHIDHIVPLIRGGSNWPWNIAITCPPCNRSKHAKTPEEWLGRDHY